MRRVVGVVEQEVVVARRERIVHRRKLFTAHRARVTVDAKDHRYRRRRVVNLALEVSAEELAVGRFDIRVIEDGWVDERVDAAQRLARSPHRHAHTAS